MKKRLYRIESGKMLAGVCGGIAEYFDIDPTLIRALWVLFCILGGSGILLYIILAVLIPSEETRLKKSSNYIKIEKKHPPSALLSSGGVLWIQPYRAR